MKTQDLLKITVTSELNTAINSMKTKEHEKHARKLAKMVNLCYEEALLKAGSIVIKAEDIKAEGTDLVRAFMEPVYDHFLQNSIEAFRDEDHALLRASNPAQAHLSSEDLKPTKEYLRMRAKRDSALFILCALLLVINGTRTNLFVNLDGIRTDIKNAQAFNRKAQVEAEPLTSVQRP